MTIPAQWGLKIKTEGARNKEREPRDIGEGKNGRAEEKRGIRRL
jgi:hypothetical protein